MCTELPNKKRYKQEYIIIINIVKNYSSCFFETTKEFLVWTESFWDVFWFSLFF